MNSEDRSVRRSCAFPAELQACLWRLDQVIANIDGAAAACPAEAVEAARQALSTVRQYLEEHACATGGRGPLRTARPCFG